MAPLGQETGERVVESGCLSGVALGACVASQTQASFVSASLDLYIGVIIACWDG
jgi:hypothetical protein